MAAPNEKLAESLGVLKAIQDEGRRVFRSNELSRVRRKRLPEGGYERLADFIQPWRAGWRHDTVVRLILGILRALLQPSFRRSVAPLAGAVALAARRKDGHSGAGCSMQPEGDEPHDQSVIQHVGLRPESF